MDLPQEMACALGKLPINQGVLLKKRSDERIYKIISRK